MQMVPYLSFNGQCEEAFKFYEKVLGGKILAMMRFAGSPMAEQMPAAFQQKIMHARIALDGQTLMGSDAPPERYQGVKGSQISLMVDKPAEADRLFNALAEGGSVSMPMQKTFFAARFGMLVDRFGIPWMIHCE